MQKTRRKYLVAAIVIILCSVNATGQEPVDSINISKYLESDVFLIPDAEEPVNVYSQDSLSIYVKHSPAKASIMSAVMPGLGQIYNRKYWKLPIVYAAVGTSVWVFVKWQNEYNRFRRAYIDLKDGDPYTNYFETLGIPSHVNLETTITKRKETLRTWRDWSIVAVVVTYALNIIDANVDAHLMDFSLDDNISFNIRPCFLENDINSKKIGLTLQFTF